MNLKFAMRRLGELVEALQKSGISTSSMRAFSLPEETISRDSELFSVEVEQTAHGLFGVRMDGLGIMSVCDCSGETPHVIRKVTTVHQAVDILCSFKHDCLNYHLMRSVA